MRRVGLRGVMTGLAALAITLASAGAAAADTSTVWPSSAAAIPLPGDAAATQAATSLPSVSCGSSSQG